MEASGHPWLILSARDGFLAPDAVIGAYAERFDRPVTAPITTDALRTQAGVKGLNEYALVIAYGSWSHIARVKAVFRGAPPATGFSIEAQRRASGQDQSSN